MDFEFVKSKVLPVLRSYDVSRAGLFGSVATGEDDESSDVDIVVEFRGEKSLLDLSGLKIEVEDLLGRRVDLVTYDSLHPLLRDRILREHKALL